MSMFINAMGHKPVEIKCDKCNNIFDIELIHFIESNKILNCPKCNHQIPNTLSGISALTIMAIKQTFDQLEETINNLDKLRTG